MLSLLKEDVNERKEDIGKLVEVFNASKDESLKKILGSSIILATYNIIEFIAREVAFYVIDDIKSKEKHVLDVNDEIQKELIKYASEKDRLVSFRLLYDKNYCQITVDKKRIVDGGNIGYKAFKKLLKTFSVDVRGDSFSIKYEGSIDLDTIKDARNDLAHGNKGFRESVYTDDQINKLYKYIEELIINIIDKLEICLNDSLYLR